MSVESPPTLPPTAARPGSLLVERYELRREIGGSTDAHIWEAFDVRLRRAVAVKIFAERDDARDRIASELEISARMTHPGLVRVFDGGNVDPAGPGHAYLVTEFVSGARLGDTLAGGPTSPEQTAAVLCAVAGALEHVHRHDIVHGAITPDNVLLPHPGSVVAAKLTGFGCARTVSSTDRPDSGQASDIHSLGLVLRAMLTGQARESRAHEPRHRRLPPRVGDRWRALLDAMCAVDPTARPTAAEVRDRAAGDDLTTHVAHAVTWDDTWSTPTLTRRAATRTGITARFRRAPGRTAVAAPAGAGRTG